MTRVKVLLAILYLLTAFAADFWFGIETAPVTSSEGPNIRTDWEPAPYTAPDCRWFDICQQET